MNEEDEDEEDFEVSVGVMIKSKQSYWTEIKLKTIIAIITEYILYYNWRYFNRGFTDTIWMWGLLLSNFSLKVNTWKK